jgi:hypothetical protein
MEDTDAGLLSFKSGNEFKKCCLDMARDGFMSLETAFANKQKPVVTSADD